MDLGTLEAIISTLKELTDELTNLGNLSTALTVSGSGREARAWLDGDASRLGEFEPYDWGGADPYTLGKPVRVGSDGELLIGSE